MSTITEGFQGSTRMAEWSDRVLSEWKMGEGPPEVHKTNEQKKQ